MHEILEKARELFTLIGEKIELESAKTAEEIDNDLIEHLTAHRDQHAALIEKLEAKISAQYAAESAPAEREPKPAGEGAPAEDGEAGSGQAAP